MSTTHLDALGMWKGFTVQGSVPVGISSMLTLYMVSGF